MFKFIKGVLFLLIFAPSFCLSEETSSPLQAANKARANPDCSIVVKTIKGLDRSEDRSDAENAIDSSFSDIKDQLKDLPFARFQQIDLIQKETDFETLLHFTPRCAMGNLHQVDITPHALCEDKVDVTINWVAPTGETMVDSRIKFPNGQSIILGTEHPKQTCTIMVVKVDCQKQ